MVRTTRTPRARPLASLREYFTLRRALEAHATLPPQVRERLAKSSSLGHRRADAAEGLWDDGHSAEALRLAIEALDASAEAARELARSLDAPAQPGAAEADAMLLRARGLSKAEIAIVEAGLAVARRGPVPVLDADVGAAHASVFRTVLDAQRALERALGMAALDRRALRRTRAVRAGVALAAIISIALLAFLSLRAPTGPAAASSAVWAEAPAFGAPRVIDGSADTYWLAPDGKAGWVEVRFASARRVERVTLLNSHNPPGGDRATRGYRVEVYAGGRLARAEAGSFEYSRSPEPVVHEIAVDAVERIRFIVLSHHHNGAGLAELSWE